MRRAGAGHSPPPSRRRHTSYRSAVGIPLLPSFQPILAAVQQSDGTVGQRPLQVKILRRAAALGMTAVLPCFVGNVPHVFSARFPAANIVPYPLWNNFVSGATSSFLPPRADFCEMPFKICRRVD